jgi:phosphoribosylamine--glycine ligase
MRVLLIGSGGREAALAWKMAQSEIASHIIVSPGNPGMKQLSPKISLESVSQFEDYLEMTPDLVVIGPEAPLSQGLTDFFESHKILVVGPTQKAAMLEGSKAFCKEIFEAAQIPTPKYQLISTLPEALNVLSRWDSEGVVVKVDSLAQGKGVIVCHTKEQALAAVTSFMDGSYLGYPVEKILLEELITGPEVSAFALCDGKNFVYLGSATDYKRLNNHDLGPNTGGMGTISPSPILTNADEEWIQTHIFAPTLKVMHERGTPFKGFLFAGLMKTKSGLKALEFNARMGDPETQSLIPRLDQDIVLLFLAAAMGELTNLKMKPLKGHAIHIVMAASGYPGTNGQKIRGQDEITVGSLTPESLFFTAGVAEKENALMTSGGRICGLTVVAASLKEAHKIAYQEIKKVTFTGAHYRQDIGAKFL